MLIYNFLQYKENNELNQNLVEDVVKIEENKEIEINWEELERINKDIIGWIKIEGTNINYPILKDNACLKYLKHSFNGKYNINGSIFTLNNEPFEEVETIVYGHNMKSNVMFSELDQYMKKDFLKKHSTFKVYTKTSNYKASIFSVYSTNVNDEENNTKNLDFNKRIDYYKKKSKFAIKDVSEIEKIIKLSTCSYLNNHSTPTNQRYFIIAKLEKI